MSTKFQVSLFVDSEVLQCALGQVQSDKMKFMSEIINCKRHQTATVAKPDPTQNYSQTFSVSQRTLSSIQIMFGAFLVLAIIAHFSSSYWNAPLPKMVAMRSFEIFYDKSLHDYFGGSHIMVSDFLDDVLQETAFKLGYLDPHVHIGAFAKKTYYKGTILPSKIWLDKLYDDRKPGFVQAYFCLNRSGRNGVPIYGGFNGLLESNRSVIITSTCNHPKFHGRTHLEQTATVFAHQLGHIMGMK